MTSCGRLVAIAHEMIGSDEVVVARIAPGLQISSRFSNSVVFTRRSSAIASTTRSQSARSSSEVDPVSRPSTSSRADSSSLPRWMALSSERSMVSRTPFDLGVGAADVQHVVPGLGEDLDDARGHRAGADDADPADVAAQPRLVVGRRGQVVGHDLRAVGRLVGVEAAAGLPAEQARGDHLLEDRRRRVQAVAALLVHRVEDLVRRVETDQVEQRQRAHRVAAAVAHRRVDVLAGGVVGLVHRDRVVEVAEQQRVGDEAGPVAADDRALAHAGEQALHVGQHLGLGHHGPDHLDQPLHGRGVEEVHADHAARAGVGGGDLGDRERGGVGGEDRVGADDLVELAEDGLLDLDRLHDRLDDEVGVGEVLHAGGEGDPASSSACSASVSLPRATARAVECSRC